MGNRFEIVQSEVKRVVVKIGSNTIVKDGAFDDVYARNVAEQVADIRQDGIDTLLTTSGAIALGERVLGGDAPRDEMAREGQRLLEYGWEEAFDTVGLKPQAVLFVPGKLAEGDRQVSEALDWGRIPMSNGDDSSGHTHPDAEQVRNNDLLSARKAIRHRAHLLNLTLPEGVLDQEGKVIPEVSDIRQVTIFDTKSENGTGGMLTKVESGLIVARSGLRVAIASGKRPDVIRDFVKDRQVGTRIVSR